MLRYLREATNATVVGVDRSLGMLALAPTDALRAVMDAERLALKPRSFNMALAMFVLFHLPDPFAGLREVRRILKDGGIVAFASLRVQGRARKLNTSRDDRHHTNPQFGRVPSGMPLLGHFLHLCTIQVKRSVRQDR